MNDDNSRDRKFKMLTAALTKALNLSCELGYDIEHEIKTAFDKVVAADDFETAEFLAACRSTGRTPPSKTVQ